MSPALYDAMVSILSVININDFSHWVDEAVKLGKGMNELSVWYSWHRNNISDLWSLMLVKLSVKDGKISD